MTSPRTPTYVEMSNAIRAAVSGAGGLPAGGTAGQVLTKASATDYDATWDAVPPAANGLPVGGTAFQSLVKASGTDYDTAWGNPTAPNGLPTGGTAGQVLTKASATDYDVTYTTGGLVPAGNLYEVLLSTGIGTGSVFTPFTNISQPVRGARDTTARTSTSATTLTATGLTFTVTSGTMYALKAWGTFRTAATTTGLGLGFSTTVATTYCGWNVQIEQAAPGTDQYYTANSLALTGVLVSTGVVAANTDYLWELEGRFQPSANGTVTIGFRSEVAASTVTWQAGAAATLTTVA